MDVWEVHTQTIVFGRETNVNAKAVESMYSVSVWRPQRRPNMRFTLTLKEFTPQQSVRLTCVRRLLGSDVQRKEQAGDFLLIKLWALNTLLQSVLYASSNWTRLTSA